MNSFKKFVVSENSSSLNFEFQLNEFVDDFDNQLFIAYEIHVFFFLSMISFY